MSKYSWFDDMLGRQRSPRVRQTQPPVENYVPREARRDITDRVIENGPVLLDLSDGGDDGNH